MFLFQTFCRSSLVAAVAVWAAGCTTPPPPPPPEVVTAAPPPAPRVVPVEVEPAAPAAQLAPMPANSPAPVAMMLAYADKLRTLNGNDLGAEIARIGDPGDSPAAQMQLALALSQTRVPADLARALGLLQRVNANPSPEAQALQPLARALAARYLEQRRVEDDRDRQLAQVKEQQRRIDQLNDRMEALRAIERSFARPNGAAAPAAPAAATPASGMKPTP